MQRDDNEDDGASHLDIASRRTNRFEGTTHLSTWLAATQVSAQREKMRTAARRVWISRRTNRFEGTTHLSTTWRLAAATQDDSRNPMGLNKLRDTAEAAKAQAGHAVPVLLGQVHS